MIILSHEIVSIRLFVRNNYVAELILLNDYFLRNWGSQHSLLQEMIKEMDSSRNAFLKQFYPGLIESKGKN